MSQLSDHEFIVVGGGAVGCGVAYALARAGHPDVLLIEQGPDVGQVTTSQGAGLCGQPRDSVERVRLAMHSVSVFRELQKDPDVKPDWNEVGSLRVALSEKRAEEFRRLKEIAYQAGLEATLIDRVDVIFSVTAAGDSHAMKGINQEIRCSVDVEIQLVKTILDKLCLWNSCLVKEH